MSTGKNADIQLENQTPVVQPLPKIEWKLPFELECKYDCYRPHAQSEADPSHTLPSRFLL